MKSTRHHFPMPFRVPEVIGAAVLSLAILAGCASTPAVKTNEGLTFRIKGSDTMLRLVNRWAEEFMKRHTNVAIYTEGGGSGDGIQALIDGDTDLSAASRTMTAEEVKLLLEKRGSLGLSILAAKDALSVYLHPDNPVRDLSAEQLRSLFTGESASWSDVGEVALPVQVVCRPPNSGTYQFFKDHVLKGTDYASTALTVPTTAAVIRAVEENVAAIGYGGLAFGPGITHCSVDQVQPTGENVRNGSYPIARYLYFFVAEPPEGAIKEFIDWVLSTEGQTIVSEVGYIPLWELDAN